MGFYWRFFLLFLLLSSLFSLSSPSPPHPPLLLTGLDSVKKRLIEAIEWPIKHRDALITMNVKPTSGILLHGPPGCGKVWLFLVLIVFNSVLYIYINLLTP